MDSLVLQVYMAQQEDSRKGDFTQLTNEDRAYLKIDYEDDEIQSMTKEAWKKLIKEQVKVTAFTELLQEKSTKEKTKGIHFEEFKLSSCLEENGRTSLSQTVFSICSKSLDIKEYQPWKYEKKKLHSLWY